MGIIESMISKKIPDMCLMYNLKFWKLEIIEPITKKKLYVYIYIYINTGNKPM